MSGTVEAIHGKPAVTTYVMRDPYEKLRRQLHCFYCGGFLIITYKEVAAVIEGSAADAAITAELKCRKCNTLFQIC